MTTPRTKKKIYSNQEDVPLPTQKIIAQTFLTAKKLTFVKNSSEKRDKKKEKKQEKSEKIED